MIVLRILESVFLVWTLFLFRTKSKLVNLLYLLVSLPLVFMRSSFFIIYSVLSMTALIVIGIFSISLGTRMSLFLRYFRMWLFRHTRIPS